MWMVSQGQAAEPGLVRRIPGQVLGVERELIWTGVLRVRTHKLNEKVG